MTGIFAQFGSEGYVRVEYPTDADRSKPTFRPGLEDLVIVIERRSLRWDEVRQSDGSVKRVPSPGGALRVAVESGRVGYVPMALVIALVLATPVPWVRRVKALLWGIVFANVFVVLRIGLLVLYDFAQDTPIRQFEFSAVTDKVLAFFYEFLFVSPTGTVLVPALIWAAVSLTREDVARLTAVTEREREGGAQ